MCRVRSLLAGFALVAALVALAALPAVSAAAEPSIGAATEPTVLAIASHGRLTPHIPVSSAVAMAMVVLVVIWASERILPRHAGRVVDVGEAWRSLLLRAPPGRG